MVKKHLSIFLTVIMISSFGTIANAQGYVDMDSNYGIQLYYSYVVKHNTSIAISNGQAICESTLTGYSGTTTKVTITMYLEKKTLWWWNTETTWVGTFNSYRGALSKTHAVGGGTYRIRTVYIAYSGSKTETITGYSQEVKK